MVFLLLDYSLDPSPVWMMNSACYKTSIPTFYSSPIWSSLFSAQFFYFHSLRTTQQNHRHPQLPSDIERRKIACLSHFFYPFRLFLFSMSYPNSPERDETPPPNSFFTFPSLRFTSFHCHTLISVGNFVKEITWQAHYRSISILIKKNYTNITY